MSLLLICPDSVSHYYPLIEIGKCWQRLRERVFVATGPGLKQRVQADRFVHLELPLDPGSNPGLIWPEKHPQERLEANLQATRRGMAAMLRWQAEGRVTDLFWRPRDVAERLRDILDLARPTHIISVQLSYNATAALLGMRVPFATFVTGHPTELPSSNELYGFPYPHHRPSRLKLNTEELAELEQACRTAQDQFTAAFNHILRELDPAATELSNGLSAVSPYLVLYHYPEMLLGDTCTNLPGNAHFVGSCVRDEPLDSGLATWLRLVRPDLPTVFVAFGSFLSLRGDILARVAAALRLEPVRVIFASGVAEESVLDPIPSHWFVRQYLPQPALLCKSDLAICHAGNNSVMEALTAGVPLLVGPSSCDQFAGAAYLERNGLGSVFDPNESSISEIRELLHATFSARAKAKSVAAKLRNRSGPQQARELCERYLPT